MAPFSNFISFIFFTTLLLPLQTNARDSQFFSKVTHSNNNNVKETELPNTEKPVNKPEEQQQQPAFIPETENSYGLYGHDSSQFPSTNAVATNYQPYKTEFEDTSKYSNNKYYHNNNYENNDAYNNHQNEFNNNNNYNNNYNMDAYGGYQNELSDTKYTKEGSYNSMRNQNTNYNNNNNNNVGANNRYPSERQGMSDTRFMEGGKYFYDIGSENNYNTQLHGEAYRGINNEKWNNYGNQVGNHGNYNYNANQNQEQEFEDEFDESEP